MIFMVQGGPATEAMKLRAMPASASRISALASPQALEEPPGQARHAAIQLQLQQHHLQ